MSKLEIKESPKFDVLCARLRSPVNIEIQGPRSPGGGEEYFPSTVPMAGSSPDPMASLPTNIDATTDPSRAARGNWVQMCTVPSVYETHGGFVARSHRAAFDESGIQGRHLQRRWPRTISAERLSRVPSYATVPTFSHASDRKMVESRARHIKCSRGQAGQPTVHGGPTSANCADERAPTWS